MEEAAADLPQSSRLLRVALILGIAIGAHLVVVLLRKGSTFLIAREQLERHPKVRSILALVTSVATFAIYFAAIGFALQEFGVSLTAYFASATVIGLAVGFGSQGVVQDVVTGLTLVFSDLIDLGDMVEVSGQVGIVRSIGMRFVVLENPLGARVYIPNRSIGNVINYPKGYVRCLVDITLSKDPDKAKAMEQEATRLMDNLAEQFPGILVAPPSVEGLSNTKAGKRFLRLKFRIWPGRAAPIETAFRQELVKRLQAIDPDFTDWMAPVALEIEKAIQPRHGPRSPKK